MSAKTSVEAPVRRSSWKGLAVLVVCVLVVAIGITWAFFAMRAVMNVGGSCADGGPYVSAQPCPDGAGLIAVAVPAMVIASIVGSGAAIARGAPNLLVPMWGFLFGALGWNFLQYAFLGEGVVWGWLVCGVLFELMALPAVYGIVVGVRNAVVPPRTQEPGAGSRWWLPVYALLGSVGFTFGWWSFAALA